jgi:hypothetical protein
MNADLPQQITLTGFFTSQKYLRGQGLSQLERLLGYRGQLMAAGAAVYAFTRIPDIWEFELKGYTNVSGGIDANPVWAAADRAASEYYKRTGMKDSETMRKTAARTAMTIVGENRLVKVKPLIQVQGDYPPGLGIPQWRVSDKAAALRTLIGTLIGTIPRGGRYSL